MPKVLPIKSLDQFHGIINRDKPIIIDFWAGWCGPCKVMSPVFEEYSDRVDNVDFYSVDVDDQPAIAQEAAIRAMPTFTVFKDGRKMTETVGARQDKLVELVETATKL